jgi:hypothetical protein
VEQDQDGDGTIDRIVHYEASGRIAQVWENLDGAGQPRTRMLYEAGTLARGEFDTDGNGKVDQWLFYDAKGHLIRAEYDQNGDGRPEQWEHFAADSQEPFKVERDTNGDGKPDATWEKEGTQAGRRR